LKKVEMHTTPTPLQLLWEAAPAGHAYRTTILAIGIHQVIQCQLGNYFALPEGSVNSLLKNLEGYREQNYRSQITADVGDWELP